MKQGKASTSGSYARKVEPSSKAVHPGGAANIGQMHGNHAMEEGTFKPNITPIDAGRGYSAPGIASITHKGGSQGRH